MNPFTDPFGDQDEETRKRQQLELNQQKGAAAERQVAMEYEMSGYEVERVQEGADFRAVRRDPLTGEKTDEKLVEVKSGNASMTERQRQEHRQNDDHVVERRDPFPWF